MNRTWWAAIGIMVVGLGGCGPAQQKVETDGLGAVVSTAPAAPTTAPEVGLDRFTPPAGECGVTLVCGIGADTGAQLGVGPNRPPSP